MTPPFSWLRFGSGWQRFFFAPVDSVTCDVIRIGYAVLLLIMCATTWSHVGMWYGASGVVPFALLEQLLDHDAWTLLEYLPHTDRTAHIAYAVLMLHAALLAIGFLTRLQSVCVYVWLLSFHHRNFLILNGEDAVFRVIGFLLIFMPIGRHLSLDAWIKRRLMPHSEAGPVPCWALRLLQIEMCLIYAGCAFSKMNCTVWIDGMAMYYTSRLDDYFAGLPTPKVLWESLLVMRLMTWSVIILEAIVPILIWFKETRWFALGLAVGLHLVLAYCMNLYLFQWIMLVGWASFVPWHRFRAAPFTATSGQPATQDQSMVTAQSPLTGQRGVEFSPNS